MNLLTSYYNGNHKTEIFSDGTKIRTLLFGDRMISLFPENIDIKLTDKCPIGCEYCHEGSRPDSKNGENLLDLVGYIRPGTEVALGGGALSSLPADEFHRFLFELKDNGVFSNITINQFELLNDTFRNQLLNYITSNLVYGIGISFKGRAKYLEDFVYRFRDRVVIHVIAGLISKEDLEYLINKKFKILILGYKYLRRGKDFLDSNLDEISNNMKILKKNIKKYLKNANTISFDCLATEQLELKKKISRKKWNLYYGGDDGTNTMYIDWVRHEYAKSSTSFNRYPLRPIGINGKEGSRSIKLEELRDMFLKVNDTLEDYERFFLIKANNYNRFLICSNDLKIHPKTNKKLYKKLKSLLSEASGILISDYLELNSAEGNKNPDDLRKEIEYLEVVLLQFKY